MEMGMDREMVSGRAAETETGRAGGAHRIGYQ